MRDSEIDIGQRTVDGIPVLWAEGPEPYTAALVFRTGRADETLPTAGLSHLVEHLALFRAGMRRFPANGLVDTSRTVFWATGTKEEAAGFLCDIAAALGDLPLDRLEAEKRVFRTEEESAGGGGAIARLLALRCGAAGYGLVDYRELGLHGLGPDEVAAWARERYTAGNAVAWRASLPTASRCRSGRASDSRRRRSTGYPGSGCPPISRTGREAWPSGT
jgi:zinc protease